MKSHVQTKSSCKETVRTHTKCSNLFRAQHFILAVLIFYILYIILSHIPELLLLNQFRFFFLDFQKWWRPTKCYTEMEINDFWRKIRVWVVKDKVMCFEPWEYYLPPNMNGFWNQFWQIANVSFYNIKSRSVKKSEVLCDLFLGKKF